MGEDLGVDPSTIQPAALVACSASQPALLDYALIALVRAVHVGLVHRVPDGERHTTLPREDAFQDAGRGEGHKRWRACSININHRRREPRQQRG